MRIIKIIFIFMTGALLGGGIAYASIKYTILVSSNGSAWGTAQNPVYIVSQ